jgi:hypothetical protein
MSTRPAHARRGETPASSRPGALQARFRFLRISSPARKIALTDGARAKVIALATDLHTQPRSRVTTAYRAEWSRCRRESRDRCCPIEATPETGPSDRWTAPLSPSGRASAPRYARAVLCSMASCRAEARTQRRDVSKEAFATHRHRRHHRWPELAGTSPSAGGCSR